MFKARTLLLPVLFLGVVACDADGDGLSDALEKKYGSDPEVADSDGDGISDGDEVDQGLDPTKADSDGDGYSDSDEIAAGTDPLDEESGIYKGGWPFNPDKDSMDDPGFNSSWSIGGMVPRVHGRDQFNDRFDLYDMASHGKPILLDISAEWCGPCREMAAWLDRNSSAFDDYNNVRRAVNQGEVIWVTFIPEDTAGNQSDQATVARWYDDFPNENVPVVVDRQHDLTSWAGLVYFPTTMLLNPDMTIEVYDPEDPTAGLAALSAQLRNQ